MDNIVILAERKHYIAVYKPAGILSQAADGKGEDMVTLLTQKLGKEVFPVHRLDRETAGVMVFAVDKAGASGLSALIADGAFHKTYLAVCEGVPEPESGEMRDLLFFDRQKNKSFVTDKKRSGVKEAALEYEVLAKTELDGKVCSLIRVRLFTGRTHQIRVQFASRKMPLVGDARYGSHCRLPMALFSHSITFRDPFDGCEVSFLCRPHEAEDAFAPFRSWL